MCAAPGIPERLHWTDQPLDPDFPQDEKLYRRFRETTPFEAWENSTEVSVNVFELKDDSYNRSKYSQPADVLFNINAASKDEHYFSYGIIWLSCGSIVDFKASINGQDRHFKLHIKHDPNECMYPHTVIQVYDAKTDTLVPKKPASIKSVARYFLLKTAIGNGLIKSYEPKV